MVNNLRPVLQKNSKIFFHHMQPAWKQKQDKTTPHAYSILNNNQRSHSARQENQAD